MVNLRRYRAFGDELLEPESGFGYTSREYDDVTGLYYYRSRFYDPQLGRFIQRDKFNEAGYVGDNPEVIFNPKQINDYAYVGNNPVMYVDPYGLYNIIISNFLGDLLLDGDYGRYWFSIFGNPIIFVRSDLHPIIRNSNITHELVHFEQDKLNQINIDRYSDPNIKNSDYRISIEKPAWEKEYENFPNEMFNYAKNNNVNLEDLWKDNELKDYWNRLQDGLANNIEMDKCLDKY